MEISKLAPKCNFENWRQNINTKKSNPENHGLNQFEFENQF